MGLPSVLSSYTARLTIVIRTGANWHGRCKSTVTRANVKPFCAAPGNGADEFLRVLDSANETRRAPSGPVLHTTTESDCLARCVAIATADTAQNAGRFLCRTGIRLLLLARNKGNCPSVPVVVAGEATGRQITVRCPAA